MRSPYPLQWPARLARTKPADRKRSMFGRTAAHGEPLSLTPYNAGVDVCDELARLASNLPSRGAGIPYADPRRGVDPGIAVWFEYMGIERVLACDRWQRPEENLRAICKSIEAMRGLERWGVADVLESVFTGFAAALPSGESHRPDWREVFGVAGLVDTLMASSTDDLLAVVRARHRKLIAEAHPDAGGDVARAADLNAALDAAVKELSA